MISRERTFGQKAMDISVLALMAATIGGGAMELQNNFDLGWYMMFGTAFLGGSYLVGRNKNPNYGWGWPVAYMAMCAGVGALGLAQHDNLVVTENAVSFVAVPALYKAGKYARRK